MEELTRKEIAVIKSFIQHSAHADAESDFQIVAKRCREAGLSEPECNVFMQKLGYATRKVTIVRAAA